jgi:hypothetical protein
LHTKLTWDDHGRPQFYAGGVSASHLIGPRRPTSTLKRQGAAGNVYITTQDNLD